MATHLQLNDSQLRDLQVIRDLEDGVIQTVIDHLTNLETVLLKPSELLTAIRSQLSGAEAETTSECLMRQALSLNGLMLRTGMEASTILKGISSGLESESSWTPENVKKWEDLQPVFRNLLCTDAFRLVATAVDLSYEYANLYRNGRILTDIRPLFTQDASDIEGAVVSYAMRLRYDSIDGEHELNIAMDENDIRDLSEQCARAIKKSRTAQKTMAKTAGIPTIVSGGE